MPRVNIDGAARSGDLNPEWSRRSTAPPKPVAFRATRGEGSASTNPGSGACAAADASGMRAVYGKGDKNAVKTWGGGGPPVLEMQPAPPLRPLTRRHGLRVLVYGRG